MLFKIVLVLVFELLDYSIADNADFFKNLSDQDKKYCSVKCATANHTLCNEVYPPHGPHVECSGFTGGLNKDEKDYLLGLHNELRRQVAVGEITKIPLSSNMLKLEWDEEVAHIAERMAEQCMNNEPDSCRITLAREDAGQNLDMITTSSRKDGMKQVVNRWFNEHDSFKRSLVDEYTRADDDSTGFSQIVWANTARLGCGFAAQERNLDKQYKLVCNYVPKGLKDGEPVYLNGIPCTQCPNGSKCSVSVPGLCTRDPKDHSNLAPKFTNLRMFTLMPLALYFINFELRYFV